MTGTEWKRQFAEPVLQPILMTQRIGQRPAVPGRLLSIAPQHYRVGASYLLSG
jgi:hypothetical protein